MEFVIKERRRLVSKSYDLDIATVVFQEKTMLEATYDRKEDNVILHNWWKISFDAANALICELLTYFRSTKCE